MSWLPDWFLGSDPDEDQKRGAAADDANAALTKQLHDQGLITDSDYLASQANIDKGRINDASAEVDQAFLEGLDQGAGNIRNGIGSTLNLAIGTPLKLIPWQIWLGLGVYVAWRLGAFNGILKRA